MAATGSDAYDKLVDHVVSEALRLLPTQLQQEIIIRRLGLRDGIYRTDKEIATALGVTPGEVRNQGRRGLQTILAANQMGRFKVGACG